MYLFYVIYISLKKQELIITLERQEQRQELEAASLQRLYPGGRQVSHTASVRSFRVSLLRFDRNLTKRSH